MAPRSTPKKIHAADATMEYRGPILEVEELTDVSVELVPEESVVQRPPQRMAPQPIAPRAMERVESLAPIALSRKPTPPARPPSADESLFEFPHPVDPALFADTTAELRARALDDVPDFDDELPPPPPDRQRLRFIAFTGVMVLAGLLVGLAIGSRSSRVETANADSPEKTESKPIEAPKRALPDPTSVAAQTTTTTTTTVDAPTTGTIVSPKWASKRRVFMDGKEVGKSGALEVKCGVHVVRIGVVGKDRKVDVPCGGKVNVLP